MQNNKQSLGFNQKLNLRPRRNGFTLVELLVVIAILGVLVTIGLVSFRSSQARGRDAQRKSDLKQIASSLELYFSDYNKYPDALAFGAEFTDGKTVYFKSLPKDPVSELSYLYRVVDSPSNQKFQLFAHLENNKDINLIETTYTCGTSLCNFSITSANTDPEEVQ
jgi:prepilin-type N-terminal cleavage/methylation domain-containing protein